MLDEIFKPESDLEEWWRWSQGGVWNAHARDSVIDVVEKASARWSTIGRIERFGDDFAERVSNIHVHNKKIFPKYILNSSSHSERMRLMLASASFQR